LNEKEGVEMKIEIKKIIDGFKNLKILVIGDAVLDTYVYGTTDRICREAPVPVFNINEQKFCCGGAANTAINLAALGAETYFMSVIGKDANGKELLDILNKHHVHCEYILKDRTRKTIAKKRVIASSNIILRMDEGSINDISESLENTLLQQFFELEDFVDAVLLSDYGFGVLTDRFIKSVKRITSSFSKPIIVDS
jgi:D-beta-D-heptose 7-phosphate kinase/D-beta-D-heptose 1-phosphate adenosyltransferase